MTEEKPFQIRIAGDIYEQADTDKLFLIWVHNQWENDFYRGKYQICEN